MSASDCTNVDHEQRHHVIYYPTLHNRNDNAWVKHDVRVAVHETQASDFMQPYQLQVLELQHLLVSPILAQAACCCLSQNAAVTFPLTGLYSVHYPSISDGARCF